MTNQSDYHWGACDTLFNPSSISIKILQDIDSVEYYTLIESIRLPKSTVSGLQRSPDDRETTVSNSGDRGRKGADKCTRDSSVPQASVGGRTADCGDTAG